jgi:hypothetical protein
MSGLLESGHGWTIYEHTLVSASLAPLERHHVGRWRGHDAVEQISCPSGLDLLDAKLLGPPRQEFVELRLGGPDNLVLQCLNQSVH